MYQKGRITENADTILQNIASKASFAICQKNWLDIVNVALHCDFTRDAFDRLIVAHAMLDNSVLITKDEKITEHYVHCVW